MKITLIVEGKTEKAFLPYLRKFLETRLSGKMLRMPRIKCAYGWGLNQDFIRMLHFTILKHGYCLIGLLFKNWRGIISVLQLATLKPSIIIIHPRIV